MKHVYVTTVEIAEIEYEIEIVAGVTCGYPAPNVQDHDAPGFADPGAGDEVEIRRVTVTIPPRRSRFGPGLDKPGHEVTVPEDLWPVLLPHDIDERIVQDAAAAADGAREAAAEARWEAQENR